MWLLPPLHHLLVPPSPSAALPDVQGIVGQRVLSLVVVVGPQQCACPDPHVVGRQCASELGGQTLGLDELVQRVEVVAVQKDLW